mmetsp:Transcript_8492/g.31371  ORF Transcript_8492/g.31371 Transcript_8492/m.31371 type:complete len:200 (+) Transcript_8492:1521-2120(+)
MSSRCRWEVASAFMVRSRAPPFLRSARDLSLASAIALWNPSSSTTMPCSSAMSCVRSTGNPNVSHSSNAFGPLMVLFSASLATFLNFSIPFCNVLPKLASSSAIMETTLSLEPFNSGKASPITSRTTSTSLLKNPCSAPRTSRPYRTALLSTRRRTNSRPSLPGLDPSVIANVRVRIWSATTRYAMSTLSLSSSPTLPV